MIDEKNIPAQQPVKGKKTRIPEENVDQRRQKNNKRPEEKGKKEPDSLNHIERTLKKGCQFRKVFRTGKSFRGISYRAVYVKNTLGYIRLGFSLSAKSGNAVKRNLIRRRIKGLTELKRMRAGVDIVILPAGKLKNAKWPDIRDDFEKMMVMIEKDIAEMKNR